MAKQKETPEVKAPPLVARSLEDLATFSDVQVEITLPGGQKMIVPMRTLSMAEWNEIGLSVLPPKPPPAGFDNVRKTVVLDYDDPGYRQALERANLERNYRRVAASLRLDIPGEDLAQKAEYLTTRMDVSIGRQLLDATVMLFGSGEAQIAARAATFRSTDGADQPHPAGAGVDESAVGGTQHG